MPKMVPSVGDTERNEPHNLPVPVQVSLFAYFQCMGMWPWASYLIPSELFIDCPACTQHFTECDVMVDTEDLICLLKQ
jgi:hypothetical protein